MNILPSTKVFLKYEKNFEYSNETFPKTSRGITQILQPTVITFRNVNDTKTAIVLIYNGERKMVE